MAQVTLNDINQYITMIRINFENAYKSQTAEEREMLLMSWYAILKNYPKEICDVAVLNAIKNAEFAPRIGAIVSEIDKMQSAFEKTEAELWNELERRLREVVDCVYSFKFTYIEPNGLSQGDNARLRVKAIFNELPPELREYVQNPSGLIQLSKLRDEQLNFEKGRFNKAMPVLRERAKTRAMLGDSDLSGVICGMGGRFLIESQT